MSRQRAISMFTTSLNRISPYKDHPLFQSRRILLVSSCAGIILAIITLGNLRKPEDWGWLIPLVLCFLSVILVQKDFADWRHYNSTKCCCASQQNAATSWNGECRVVSELRSERTPLLSSHPESSSTDAHDHSAPEEPEEPEHRWPQRSIMIADFFLGIASLYFYTIELSQMSGYSYGYTDTTVVVFQAYVSLCTLCSGVIHLRSWWVEFMARQKQEWEREQIMAHAENEDLDIEALRAPCACNHHEPHSQDHGDASQILARVLAFLRKGETSATADNATTQFNGASSSKAAVPTTPGSSATESSTEDSDEHSSDPTTKLPSDKADNITHQYDTVLVSKKTKSKKGKGLI